MTKYILHGGETGIPNENNAAFYQEWVKSFKNDFVPTILLVYFARPFSEWNNLLRQDQERLAGYTNNRPVNLVLASSNLNEFLKQIGAADVVYVRGGNTKILMNILEPVKDEFLVTLNGKIYAGSSAGVMAITQATRSNDASWQQGFGFLPINSFVHYSKAWEDDLENFKQQHPENNFEYLLLPETEFLIREY